jgi:hypothetical protein
MELFSVQRHIRDFYFKEALAAPDSVAHVHKPGLVPDQRLFSVADLRRHLNNPLLDLNYLNFFLAGKPVDLSEARAYKVVQRRRIEFVDIACSKNISHRGGVRARRRRHSRPRDQRARRRSGSRACGDILQCHGFLLAAWPRGLSGTRRHRRCAGDPSRGRKTLATSPAAIAAARDIERSGRRGDGHF